MTIQEHSALVLVPTWSKFGRKKAWIAFDDLTWLWPCFKQKNMKFQSTLNAYFTWFPEYTRFFNFFFKKPIHDITGDQKKTHEKLSKKNMYLNLSLKNSFIIFEPDAIPDLLKKMLFWKDFQKTDQILDSQSQKPRLRCKSKMTQKCA